MIILSPPSSPAGVVRMAESWFRAWPRDASDLRGLEIMLGTVADICLALGNGRAAEVACRLQLAALIALEKIHTAGSAAGGR